MLIIICGLPGSGKSTIAKELSKRLEDSIRISSDNFKERVYEKIRKKIKENIGRHSYVIVNATFYKKEHREILKEFKDIFMVKLECPLEVCIERDRKRENSIGEKAVRIIYSEFEPIKADLMVDTSKVSPKEAVKLILIHINRNLSLSLD